MAVNDNPANIFEAASQQYGKSKKPSQAKAIIHPAQAHAIIKKKAAKSEREIAEMLEKIHTMQHDLEFRLHNLETRSGMNHEQFNRWLKHFRNFNADDLEKMRQKEDEFSKKVWGVIGIRPRNPKQSTAAPVNTVKTEKERKAKTIGARKNWISMR